VTDIAAVLSEGPPVSLKLAVMKLVRTFLSYCNLKTSVFIVFAVCVFYFYCPSHNISGPRGNVPWGGLVV